MNNYQGTQFSLLNNNREAYSNGKVSYWVNKPLKNTIQMRSPASLDNQIRKPQLYTAYGPNGFGLTYKAGLHEQQLPFLNQSVETIDPFSGKESVKRPKHNLITAKNESEFFLGKYTYNKRVKNGTQGTPIDRTITNLNHSGNTIDYKHYPNLDPYRQALLTGYENDAVWSLMKHSTSRGPSGDQSYHGFPSGITGRQLVSFRNNSSEANIRQGSVSRNKVGGGSSGVARHIPPPHSNTGIRNFSNIPGHRPNTRRSMPKSRHGVNQYGTLQDMR